MPIPGGALGLPVNLASGHNRRSNLECAALLFAGSSSRDRGCTVDGKAKSVIQDPVINQAIQAIPRELSSCPTCGDSLSLISLFDTVIRESELVKEGSPFTEAILAVSAKLK